VLLAVCLAAAAFGGQVKAPVAAGETLTLDKCIAVALERQPALASAREAVSSERALVRQAEAGYYPQIFASTSASKSSRGSATSFGITTPPVTFNYYSVGVSLSQNVFDFGKTASQVRIQKLGVEASMTDLRSSEDTVVYNVKQAYYGVLAAKRSRDVAAEAVNQYKLHLDQAKGFYEVGTAPKYDVTKAEVDLGNARISLIKAENGVRLALAALNNAMGIIGTLDYGVEDNLAVRTSEISFDDALARAYDNRPDLKSVEARARAGESSVGLAKKGYLPALNGSAGYNYTGNAFPLARGWNLGLSLSLPVFNGFLTAAQVTEAKASLGILRANAEAVRQTVFLDVQTAFLDVAQAADLIPVAELNVTAAQENFEIANGMYAEGLGDTIQVADAAAALSNAKLAHIQALYDYQIARAGLEKAMGAR